MKLEQLTKPQIILLWMTTCSKYTDALCEGDKDVLIKYKLFKDKKSISNALYRLHDAGYIKKFKDSWFILDAGKQHLKEVIARIENNVQENHESHGPKANEWTDADFEITPEVRAYIDKLETENAKLKELLDHAHALHKSNLATYDAISEENMKLKAQLEKLNAQLKKSYTIINIGACNEFVEACSKFINSINTI